MTLSTLRHAVGSFFILAILGGAPASAAEHPGPWTFVVSGDSRNCGDVVMPSIAAGARADRAAFYWHLGDLRAIHAVDEDYLGIHPGVTLDEYLPEAWTDVINSQIASFGDMPFYLGIGNHETVPPKTREEFTRTFTRWLDMPEIRKQRLKDDPHDRMVRTYYHWVRDGVDFINLDNATTDQFDAGQLHWVNTLLARDRTDAGIRALVVGMHEALPESIAKGHSMSDSPAAEIAGTAVYAALLEVRKAKPVYVLASHSHYVMEGVFDTPYWRTHGGVLYGWIIGTGGAFRYALPPTADQAKFAKTHVYGYLQATVSPRGVNVEDPIWFDFKEVTEAMTPPGVIARYGATLVHWCHRDNAAT